MTIEIKELEVEKEQKGIYNPKVTKSPDSDFEILRITEEAELTRIDFLFMPQKKRKGGWVQIKRQTYIRPTGSSIRYSMVKAVGIPIHLLRDHSITTLKMFSYTLYFPKLPKGTTNIDIIESESTNRVYFNFYGVHLTSIKSEKLLVYS
jgi:hypothetical protein